MTEQATWDAGALKVTALRDGEVQIASGFLLNASPDVAAAQDAAPASSIMAYLLRGEGRTMLIDAGSGSFFGPNAGHLPAALAEAGVSPDEIEAVLITHMHVDHVGGLISPEGAPLYPRAVLHVPQIEHDYWTSDAERDAAPEDRRSSFDLPRRVLSAYAGRVDVFSGNPSLGLITAVALPGHTPGHTGYRVGELLVWGDIIHAQSVQASHPEVGIAFDSDPAQAVATRQAILAEVARDGTVVAGMHLRHPPFVRVVKAGDGYLITQV